MAQQSHYLLEYAENLWCGFFEVFKNVIKNAQFCRAHVYLQPEAKVKPESSAIFAVANWILFSVLILVRPLHHE